MDPKPPTASLPALRDIDTHSLSTITAALINLRALYWPASTSTSLVHTRAHASKPQTKKQPATAAAEQRVHDSGYASAVDDDDDDGGAQTRKRDRDRDREEQEARLGVLRADALERAFALRWLTGFIARSEGWVGAGTSLGLGCDSAYGDGDGEDRFGVDKERENRERVVDEAVALLALSADTQADGTLSREFSFAVGGEAEGAWERIVVELRDESYEDDHESVGLQTWGSACVLAERLCADPGRYLAFDAHTTTIRVLELGAGTGLLSMVVAKLAQAPCVRARGVRLDVVATDYHPAVLENLQENVAHNFGLGGGCGVRVEMLDWADAPAMAAATAEDRFDVILAADVVYDRRHGAWIKSCAEKMLRGVMWLMVPMRPTRMGEVESLHNVFQGPGLCILEVQDVPRHHSVGRADEDGYRLFRIGWPSAA